MLHIYKIFNTNNNISNHIIPEFVRYQYTFPWLQERQHPYKHVYRLSVFCDGDEDPKLHSIGKLTNCSLYNTCSTHSYGMDELGTS